MFCEKCGKENPAEAKFCEGCGATLEGTPAAGGAQAVFENVKAAVGGADQKVVKIGIIAAAVAVVLILLAIFGAFKPGSVKALTKAHKGYLNANAKAYFAVQWSPYTEAYEWEKDEKNEVIEETQEELKDAKAERKDEKVKITFKNYKVSKKYKKSEVNKIADYMEENWDYDVDSHKLQAVQVVKYTEVVKEDGDTDSDTEEVVMIKVKGKWYVENRLSKDFIKNSILKADKED